CACASKHRRTRITAISWPRRSDCGSRCSTRAHQGHIAHSVAVLQLTHASRELSACEREDVAIDLALVISRNIQRCRVDKQHSGMEGDAIVATCACRAEH